MKRFYFIFVLILLVSGLNTNAFAFGSGTLERDAMTIYPNPVVYEAKVSLDQNIDLSEYEVNLYFFNIVGEMVYAVENIQSHDFTVNKEQFRRSGIYLFQLKMNGEVLKTGKINIH